MWIVIDCHGVLPYTHIVATESGDNLSFLTEAEAVAFAKEECQCGVVVRIPFPWNCM